MRTSNLLKVISLILVMCIFTESVFVQALVSAKETDIVGDISRTARMAQTARTAQEEAEEFEPEAYGTPGDSTSIFDSDKEVSIVSELEYLRTADTAHYRLSDGTVIACVYPQPVHYREGGEWKEIDNTLVASKDGNVFTNKAGSSKIDIFNSTEDGKLVKLTKDGYSVNMGVPSVYGKDDFSFSEVKSENKYSINKDIQLLSEFSGVKDTLKLNEVRVFFNEDKNEYRNKNTLEAEEFEASVKISDKYKLRKDNIESSVVFKDIYASMDFEYIVTPSGVKENIYLKERQKEYKYIFTLDLEGLRAELNSDKSITLYSEKDNKGVYIIEAPYMLDSAGEESTDIGVELLKLSDGKYELLLSANSTWVNAPERVFPVVIDPTVTEILTATTITDASVTSASPNSTTINHGGSVYVGRESSQYQKTRTFMKFNLPKVLTEADQVISARMGMLQYAYSAYDYSKTVQVNMHKVTSSWNTVSWNTMPSYKLSVEDYAIGKHVSTSYYYHYYDITKMAREWHENPSTNYGFMLKMADEEATENASNAEKYKYIKYYSPNNPSIPSSYYPTFTVVYMNCMGLEDYWSTHSYSAGRAGNISVNDFTGNMVYIHEDVSTVGNRMPAAISHVFNHSERSNKTLNGSGVYTGAGWRLNICQRIETANIANASNVKYIYTDGDGTKHYIIQDSSGYRDEFNSRIKFTIDSTYYYLKYPDGEEKAFYKSNGMLYSMTDTNLNSIKIYYSGGRLSYLLDGAGRRINFNINSSGYLESISDPSGRLISYTYNSAQQLIKITYPDGEYVNLNHGTPLYALNSIVSSDGSQVKIAYKTNNPYRTAKITEYGKNGSEGNYLNFSYSTGETSIRDREGRYETVMFDNTGKTICVKDNYGNAVYGKYEGTNNDTKNQITFSSNLQKPVNNYMLNHGAENGVSDVYVYKTGSGQGTLTTDSITKYMGNNSFKVVSTSSSGTVGLHSYGITVKAGKTYTLSAYVRTSGATGSSAIVLGLGYGSANGWYMSRSYHPQSGSWKKISYTFTIPQGMSDLSDVFVGLNNSTGTLYVDNIQLEEGLAANRTNLIQNGSLEYTSSGSIPNKWTRLNTSSGYSAESPHHEKYGFYIAGKADEKRELYQDITLKAIKGESIIGGVWAKGTPVPNTYSKNSGTITPVFALILRAYYKRTDGTTYNKEYTFSLDSKSTDWQYVTGSFYAEDAVETLRVILSYSYQQNSAMFDEVQIYRDSFGEKYDYDSYGRLSTVKDALGKETKYEYSGTKDLVTKVKYPDNSITTNEYDSRGNLLKTVNQENEVFQYTYDSYGNVLTSKVTGIDGTMQTTNQYTSDGNFLYKVTDSRGKSITYNYNQIRGLLYSVADAAAQTVYYTYDARNDRLLKSYMMIDGQMVDNVYTYEDDQPESIEHNGFSYNFEYDEYGNSSAVKVGSRTLISNMYASYNGNLTQSTYGNGQYIGYTYDNQDRIVGKSYNGSLRYAWDYSSGGLVEEHTDNVNGTTERYEYDSKNRLVKSARSDGYLQQYTYDNMGRISYCTTYLDSAYSFISYNYSKTGQQTEASVSYSNYYYLKSNSYDSLGRISSYKYTNRYGAGVPSYESKIEYVPGTGNSTTTGLVESIENGTDKISYTYDNRGNILTVTEGTTLKVKYYYDELSQLEREDNTYLNKTVVYTYDKSGNILNKKEYPYTTGTLGTLQIQYDYEYGDSEWKDLLTSYDGYAITYDQIGNMKTYKGNTYTWEEGRRLTNIQGSGKSIYYKYDADGIRTQKTVNGVMSKYYTDGTRVNMIVKNGVTTNFFYGADGVLISMHYNGKPYYYVYNVQGDVIGLLDENMNRVVSYTYDSWGNILAVSDTTGLNVGSLNPFRYRGYMYDEETGLYYLQSRYYDPDVGRFINADVILDLREFQGLNLFSYCGNNPINRIDSSGMLSFLNTNPLDIVSNTFSDLFYSKTQTLPYSKELKATNSNIVKATPNRRPNTGTPGSTYRAPNGDTRTYGPDGKPQHDYDHDDHGQPDKHPHDENDGHNHDWENGVRGPAYADFNWKPVAGVALTTVCVIGIVIVAVDDVTVIGVADDFLFGPLGAGVGEGLIMIFG